MLPRLAPEGAGWPWWGITDARLPGGGQLVAGDLARALRMPAPGRASPQGLARNAVLARVHPARRNARTLARAWRRTHRPPGGCGRSAPGSASARIDRPSRPRSRLICSNSSTRDPIPSAAFPLALESIERSVTSRTEVGPDETAAARPVQTAVPSRPHDPHGRLRATFALRVRGHARRDREPVVTSDPHDLRVADRDPGHVIHRHRPRVVHQRVGRRHQTFATPRVKAGRKVTPLSPVEKGTPRLGGWSTRRAPGMRCSVVRGCMSEALVA